MTNPRKQRIPVGTRITLANGHWDGVLTVLEHRAGGAAYMIKHESGVRFTARLNEVSPFEGEQ